MDWQFTAPRNLRIQSDGQFFVIGVGCVEKSEWPAEEAVTSDGVAEELFRAALTAWLAGPDSPLPTTHAAGEIAVEGLRIATEDDGRLRVSARATVEYQDTRDALQVAEDARFTRGDQEFHARQNGD